MTYAAHSLAAVGKVCGLGLRLSLSAASELPGILREGNEWCAQGYSLSSLRASCQTEASFGIGCQLVKYWLGERVEV